MLSKLFSLLNLAKLYCKVHVHHQDVEHIRKRIQAKHTQVENWLCTGSCLIRPTLRETCLRYTFISIATYKPDRAGHSYSIRFDARIGADLQPLHILCLSSTAMFSASKFSMERNKTANLMRSDCYIGSVELTNSFKIHGETSSYSNTCCRHLILDAIHRQGWRRRQFKCWQCIAGSQTFLCTGTISIHLRYGVAGNRTVGFQLSERTFYHRVM